MQKCEHDKNVSMEDMKILFVWHVKKVEHLTTVSSVSYSWKMREKKLLCNIVNLLYNSVYFLEKSFL